MLVHRRVTPSIKLAGTHLYTWVKRDTVSVKCLAQQHNTEPRPWLEPRLLDPDFTAPPIPPDKTKAEDRRQIFHATYGLFSVKKFFIKQRSEAYSSLQYCRSRHCCCLVEFVVLYRKPLPWSKYGITPRYRKPLPWCNAMFRDEITIYR